MRFPHAAGHCSRIALLALGVSALAACAAKEGAPPDIETGLCPSCEPSAGGETGDFSGTQSVCTLLLAPAPIEEAEARALGYDPAELRRRLTQALDLPLMWRVPGSQLDPPRVIDESRFEMRPPTGFSQEETRISLSVHATDALIHVRPDPDYCDGSTCRRALENGTMIDVPQTSCEASLNLDVTIDVETADGAVRGTLKGRAEKVSSRDLTVLATADLTQLAGKLRLWPKTGFGKLTGTLWLTLELEDAATHGDLSPTVFFWDDREEEAQVYSPISAAFPSERPQEPAGAGRVSP